MRTHPTVFFVAIAILAMPSAAWAYEDGATGFSGQSAATCSMCHTSGTFTPVVSLAGPIQVAPSSIDNPYTFEVAELLASVGGFDVSADGGALSTTDSGAQVSSGEVTHTAPLAFGSDVASFTFEWTAPATEGTYTLFGCGVAADDNGLFTGDDADCATLSIVVCGDFDNCPTDANSDQTDSDGDGLGDACDTPTDTGDTGTDTGTDTDADTGTDTGTDTGGGGTGDTADTTVACNCSTSPTGGAVALLPALLGLAALRRRHAKA